ncbi:MAG: hypothetical protein JSW61_11060 [Candidatus Thorarchaeota archaeon]|nr:MAG: hypothetical protein JSW61_11060 [Candidatus Thorarchaeota archaeon]
MLALACYQSDVIALERLRYHRLMFLTAALWNWILAVSFLVLPRVDISYFFLAGSTIPSTLLWFDSFMGLVFVFGIGFYLVSLSPDKNHGIIKMGIFEKSWVFVIGLYYFLIAEATFLVFLFVSVDLLFGLLFLEDLLSITRTS